MSGLKCTLAGRAWGTPSTSGGKAPGPVWLRNSGRRQRYRWAGGQRTGATGHGEDFRFYSQCNGSHWTLLSRPDLIRFTQWQPNKDWTVLR